MEHLELEDLLNLKIAYPSLQLQMWEEKQRRNKFLHEVTEFESNIEFSCCFNGHGCCSHYGHPIFTTIGCGRPEWKNSRMEELKEMISKLGPDINKIPRVQPKFENSVQTQDAFVKFCDWEGLTPLLFCTFKDDLETVRLLVENGSDIYETGDSMHQNCLHATVPRPSLKVARYLIEELKMDKERLDGEQQTALDVASKMVEWFGGADSIQLVQLLTE